LQILVEAEVKFRPGIYVIKDGPLVVSGKINFTGKDVGFYLVGDLTSFSFSKNVAIDISAPRDGPMAGILFFEDRNAPPLRSHAIKSDFARVLTGTIYLPQGVLKIDASKKVAQESAYTVVISRELKLYSGPHLILNSNYGDTDVPLPEGLRGAASPGKDIVLVD
jgi:hypothetical protein